MKSFEIQRLIATEFVFMNSRAILRAMMIRTSVLSSSLLCNYSAKVQSPQTYFVLTDVRKKFTSTVASVTDVDISSFFPNAMITMDRNHRSQYFFHTLSHISIFDSA